MKTFSQWAKDNNFEIPVLEYKKNTGITPAYPSGYARSQYPDAYWAAHSATAYLDLQNAKKVKDVAPSA